MDPKEIAERDAAYRAIGRYVVEFSSLVWCMRSLIETRFAGPLAGESPEDEPSIQRNRDVVELVLGEATAQPIANALFGMCRMEGNLDAAEEAVGNALRERVNRVIETRNDIAHGDWVAWFPGNPPWLMRVRPARKRPTKLTEYPPEILDQLSDELQTLQLRVLDYGASLSDSGCSIAMQKMAHCASGSPASYA